VRINQIVSGVVRSGEGHLQDGNSIVDGKGTHRIVRKRRVSGLPRISDFAKEGWRKNAKAGFRWATANKKSNGPIFPQGKQM